MEIKGKARYQRQMLLQDFGVKGQEKLFRAKVLVIGAGGLGCPILQYLAAAGVGTLGIVDHDTVELSNLHRQTLYSVIDVGRLKADCATERLSQFNPDIKIISYPLQLNNQNAALILSKFDVVIDGSDNFPTRYLVNDACVLLNLPLVYGALSVSEGHIAIFNVSNADGVKVNYRDLFPNPPLPGEVLNCSEAGVLGVLPGIVGTMQASEAIKLIAGIGQPLINQMLIYNLYSSETYKVNLSPSKEEGATAPKDLDAFLQTDYNWFCGIKEQRVLIPEMSPGEFREAVFEEEHTIIDVREPGESPVVSDFEHLHIPLSEIRKKIPLIQADKVILFCQSGVRSVIAAKLLQEAYPDKAFYSLAGGVLRLT